MGQERLNAIEAELGIKEKKPILSEQANTYTPIGVDTLTPKSKSRLDEIEEEVFQTTITNQPPLNSTFKDDDFINNMEASDPPEVNNKYAYAFKLGLADTYRGVKQIAGKDKEEMKAEQRKLNELMRGEGGGLVTAAYFGGALLDPAGWLIPFGKAKTLYTMAKYGMVSGAIAGATGYVDTEEGLVRSRGGQALLGAAGGAVVAPGIGALRNLGVKITGKGELTPIGFKRANLTPSEMIERGGSTVQVKGKAIEEDLSQGKIYAEGDRTLGVRPEGEIGEQPTSVFDELVKIFRKKDVKIPFPKTQKIYDAPKEGELASKPQFFLNKLLKGYEGNVGKRILKVASTGEGGTALAGGLAGFNLNPELPIFSTNAPLSSRFGRAFLGATFGYLGVSVLKKGQVKRVYGSDTDEPVTVTESYAEVLGRQIIDKYGLTKDYKILLQKYDGTKNDIASAFVRMSKQIKKLSEDERKILYNMLEGDIKYDVPSDKLVQLSKDARKLITATGQKYVDLDLLTKETFNTNKSRYLGRLYRKGDEPVELKSIGDDLKPRGHLEEVTVGDWFRKYKNQKPTINDVVDPDHKGWELLGDFEEINGQLYEVLKRSKPTPIEQNLGLKGKVLQKEIINRDQLVPVRWQLTKEQRLKMGEIEDAAISIEYTGALMANTVAKYQFYSDVAAKFAQEADGRTASQMLALPQKYIKIPESRIKGTKSKRFGALAGKYVPENVYKDIIGTKRYQEKSSNAFYEKYKKLNSLWKVSKTAWNPTVHVNNVFGNIILSDLADVPLTGLPNAFRALRTHGTDGYRSESVMLAIKHGVFDADFVNKEIKNFKQTELAGIYKSKSDADADEWDSAVSFASNIYNKVKNNSITSKLEDWYRIEDHVFRLNAFMHRIKLGETAEDAALFARKQFIDYDIDAPLINTLRNTATPFLSFTYRLIPILAESAILRPTKFVKYAVAGYGLNKMEELYGGDDAKIERALLPDYEAGNIMDLPFMPKKLIRLPVKSKDGVSKYLNISRFYPGGDVLSFSGDSAIPLLPEPLQPSFGVGGDFFFSMIGFDIFRMQREFGRGGGSAEEEITKAFGTFGKKLIPNFPFIPGSYSTKKLERALRGDVSKYREPQTELEALLTSFGFKVSNKSIRTLGASQKVEFEREMRVQKSRVKQFKNQVANNQITMADYDRQVGKVLAKINKLTNKFVGRFDGIDPHAMTFDSDMTGFMGSGDKATKKDIDYD
jgi:hypothetical protein